MVRLGSSRKAYTYLSSIGLSGVFGGVDGVPRRIEIGDEDISMKKENGQF